MQKQALLLVLAISLVAAFTFTVFTDKDCTDPATFEFFNPNCLKSSMGQFTKTICETDGIIYSGLGYSNDSKCAGSNAQHSGFYRNGHCDQKWGDVSARWTCSDEVDLTIEPHDEVHFKFDYYCTTPQSLLVIRNKTDCRSTDIPNSASINHCTKKDSNDFMGYRVCGDDRRLPKWIKLIEAAANTTIAPADKR